MVYSRSSVSARPRAALLIAVFYLFLEVVSYVYYGGITEAALPLKITSWQGSFFLSLSCGFATLGVAAIVGAINQVGETINDLLGPAGPLGAAALALIVTGLFFYCFTAHPIVSLGMAGIAGVAMFSYQNRGIRRGFCFTGNTPPLRPLEAMMAFAVGFLLSFVFVAIDMWRAGGTITYNLIADHERFLLLHLHALSICGQMLAWHYLLYQGGRLGYGRDWKVKLALPVIFGALVIVSGDFIHIAQTSYLPYAFFATVSALVVVFWRNITKLLRMPSGMFW